jgi:hypothetical protein
MLETTHRAWFLLRTPRIGMLKCWVRRGGCQRLWAQVRGAAELKSREEVHAGSAEERRFSFKEYMMQRAELVNAALDRAVPLQYPEAVTEAMRYKPAETF